jgi:CRP-like cAMP-binding protein
MSLEQDIGRLGRTRPFDLLPRDALKLIAFSAERKTIGAGRGIFEQGEEADGAYFILSGSVLLTAHGEGEPRELVVGPGALIGEMAMFAPIARPASARAQDETVVLRIPRHVMTRVLNEFPHEAARMRSALAQRTRELTAELDAVRRRANF